MRGIAAFLLGALLPGQLLAHERGDMVFSELLIAPATGMPEWVEMRNPRGSAVDLTSCVLAEADHSFTLPALVVPSGQYVLVSKTDACAIYTIGGECVRASDVVYTQLTLNNTGPETITLTCGQGASAVVLDEVTYDWTVMERDCIGASFCSVNLASDREDADENDDWQQSWCVPPAGALVFDQAGHPVVATPWAGGECPQPGPACELDDVVFTELMIDPPTSTREWFELKVEADPGCDLQACQLWEGPEVWPPFEVSACGDDDDSAGEAASPCDCPSEGWDCHEIDAPGNSLWFGPGAYGLFASGADTVVGQPGDPGSVDAHYRYDDIGMGNSELGFLHLVCGGDVIESVPYDWDLFAAGCQGSCTVGLRADLEDPWTNDDFGAWCLAPDGPDDQYPSSDDAGSPFFGTPGQPASCLARDWPAPGDVLFSEMMLAPHDTAFPEWFELASRVDRTVELAGCTLRRFRPEPDTDDDDADDDSAAEGGGDEETGGDLQEYVIGESGSFPALAPLGTLVMLKTRCMDGTTASQTGTCWFGETIQYTYGSLSFSNGDMTEELSLLCPDPLGGDPLLVDRAVFNQQRMGDRQGHSMEFDVAREDAASLNDDFEEWCEASFVDCIPGTSEEGGECHYGTPGIAGPCRTGQVDVPPSGPGCRCDAPRASRPAVLAVLVLGAFLLTLARRRMP